MSYAQVNTIFRARCYQCHSSSPTDDFYKVAPNGVLFETETQVREKADKIHLQVVLAKVMPLGNKTGMTDEERGMIKAWLNQQGLSPAP